MISAEKALQRLKEGNLRFRSHDYADVDVGAISRNQLVQAQSPFAIILGCSDSRVPAELVFGQGLGDLFVIRVAGNIVAPSQIGSIEFAAEKFGTHLVVVLGHSMCGAVEATLEQLQQDMVNRSPNLHAIVDRIRPAVESLVEFNNELDSEDNTGGIAPALLGQAVRCNIKASVDKLQQGSEILEALIKHDKLLIVGAEYFLETGEVEFFDR
ncbi:MAG: carbonic anhydrase [Proteobacteria bacterium]|nr:carbonic anhydrase [Pseudomonadota bacterium]